MSSLKMLISTRKFVRKAVTESHNIRDQYDVLDVTEKRALKTKLTDWVSRLKDLDSEVQKLKWDAKEDETELGEELELAESYQNKLRSCLALLEMPQPSQPISPNSVGLKCPTAPLPRYAGGEKEDLTKFLSQFEAVVDKYMYSDYEKLLLLRQQLGGRALILINSLESHNLGYVKAKELLEKALASPVVQIFNTLKQLSELSLDQCDDPFEYVSNVRGIMENVNKLKISVDNVMQYFVWTGLNEPFRNLLINITSHTWPSIQEICDNFFTACERYAHQRKKKKEQKQSTEMAVKVNFKSERMESVKSKVFPCSLCSSEENKALHNIRDCTKFPSPSSKVEELKKVNGCTRCGFTSHSTRNCKYRFRDSCGDCGDFHWYYLCTHTGERVNKVGALKGNSTGDKGDKKNKGKRTQEKNKDTTKSLCDVTTVTEALQNSSEGETILPTFTCTIDGYLVRCMKDSGCQSNFVSKDLFDRLKPPVLQEKINLTLNGINIPQEYTTNQVELTLEFGDCMRKIKALVLPHINITLSLPKLSEVRNGFLSKGYDLADKKLMTDTEDIADIQVILGSKSCYCIPETEITFGKEHLSLYSKTPHGVMLKGDITGILKDLPYLPYSSEISNVMHSSVIETVPDRPFRHEATFCLATDLDFTCKISDDDTKFSVLDDDGKEVEDKLLEASNELLEVACEEALNKDVYIYSDETVEIHDQLVKYALENTTRTQEGRLLMPLLWNPRVSHLLGKNFNLSRQVLTSLQKKSLRKNDDSLVQINRVFKEQEEAGIIERIDNLDQFLDEHPESSFLPFMGIFKPDRETTKCRVVYLSNLSQKGSMNHNQTLYAGPSLNQKLSTAIINLRFGSKLCCWDIKKAFNNINLEEVDQNRLCFLWFRNIEKQDFSLVGYRNCRLPFGLRCSPTVLMLGLYKMLVLDSTGESMPVQRLKRLIYQLSYMDNCAFTAESSENLLWMYKQLESIFDPYKFKLQQFMTNDLSLQTMIGQADHETPIETMIGQADHETPIETMIDQADHETPIETKLLGLQWNRLNDTLSTKQIRLEVTACTKRQILSTIASQFDLLNFNGPLMNRARLFLHTLQCRKDIGWDEELSTCLVNDWKNITNQANAAPPLEFPRNFGSRTDRYKLIGFADSSKVLFGTVIYLLNIDTNNVFFILARNKLVNKQLETKSIPSLELQALALATETLNDLKHELTGNSCIDPINIEGCEVYSDSLVVLSWLQSYALKLDKLQRKPPFVLNRLECINKLCEKTPMKFSFVSGEENPADCITRPLSYRLLMKTCYISGPSFIRNASRVSVGDTLSFIVPGSSMSNLEKARTVCVSVCSPVVGGLKHLISLDGVSSFRRLVRIHALVLRFCNNLKARLKVKNSIYDHFEVESDNFNFYAEACRQIILKDQMIHYPDVFNYFRSSQKTLKGLPNIVSQLNLFVDARGLIRVKCKCQRFKSIQKLKKFNFPLLVSNESSLAPALIRDLHVRLLHAGCYSVLADLRRHFWITRVYSSVKKVLSECIHCKRVNERVIKLNQSPYPEFRISPDTIPYRQIFIDHMGPFKVKNEQGNTVKVWLLCITCLWSRAINLKVCKDLTVEEFLRSLQLHTYDYGIPSLCLSDLGSQLVAGANCISSFVRDYETSTYLQEHGITAMKFEQYYKGRSELGSLVESCVKLTKRLLFGAMRNNILPLRDFEFIVCKTIHLVNRRPISFKESLRDSTGDDLPEVITPEMLIHCRELVSINLIPQLQGQPDIDPEFGTEQINSSWAKLQKVRHNLIKMYNDEFLGNLMYQAVNQKDRYRPVKHKTLSVGDIVLLKEPLLKSCNYPLGRIMEVITNINDEITGVKVLKGKTRETVKRHSSTVIPILSVNRKELQIDAPSSDYSQADSLKKGKSRPSRQAAADSREKTRQILADSD